MTEQERGCGCRTEGDEVRRDVVHGRDELLVEDMGDSDEESTREGHGQKDADHGLQSAHSPPIATTRSRALRLDGLFV